MTKRINMLPGISIPEATELILSLDFSQSFTDQVKDWVTKNIFNLKSCEEIGLVGQSAAAIMMLPAIEMIAGLPKVATYQPGQSEVLAWVDTAEYRHKIVRSRRTEIPEGDAFSGITVLDGGGRGLTAKQSAQIARHFVVSESQIQVLNLGMGQVDMTNPTAGMADKVINCGITTGDVLHPERMIYVPAGAGLVGSLMALTIYGLTESWPQTLRLNKEGEEFVVAEILQPQDMRQYGVAVAEEFRKGNAPVSISRDLYNRLCQAVVNTELYQELKNLTE